MQAFTTLTSIAAPLDLINIDTDMIIPKQFLKTIKRTGLGQSLFYEMRFDMDGKEIEDFVLNTTPFNQAKILIAGDNFGCGSSREHAPWAILDYGIQAIIAPSFADIFYNNCSKNGILPVCLSEDEVAALMEQAKNQAGEITIDLAAQTVTDTEGKVYSFEIDAFRKHSLLNGLDDIALTLKNIDKIDRFETKNKQEFPWLYQEGWSE